MRKLVVKFSSCEAFESHVMRAKIGGADPVPSFFLYASQVVKQLASAQGLLGYSFLAARFRSDSGPCPRGRTNRAGCQKIADCF